MTKNKEPILQQSESLPLPSSHYYTGSARQVFNTDTNPFEQRQASHTGVWCGYRVIHYGFRAAWYPADIRQIPDDSSAESWMCSAGWSQLMRTWMKQPDIKQDSTWCQPDDYLMTDQTKSTWWEADLTWHQSKSAWWMKSGHYQPGNWLMASEKMSDEGERKQGRSSHQSDIRMILPVDRFFLSNFLLLFNMATVRAANFSLAALHHRLPLQTTGILYNKYVYEYFIALKSSLYMHTHLKEVFV